MSKVRFISRRRGRRVRFLVDPRRHLLVRSLVSVPKEACDVEAVKYDLTVTNGAYWQAASVGASVKGKVSSLPLYRETDGFIHVPRHYKLDKVDSLPRLDLRRDHPRPGMRVRHHVKLRDEVQAEASAALQRPGDKIIALACGKGKTVVSLHAAAEVQKFPLLVVVHTNALKDQWIENRDDAGNLIGGIAKFYGLKRHEIGVVQGGECRWRGYKVVVAMLHSLVLKQYPPEFYDYFRLVIFDECHRLGAEFFSKACAMFPCERWGLSATYKREDGMDRVFRLHLGNVVYENLEQPLSPRVVFVHTDVDVDEKRFTFRRGRVNLSQLVTKLSTHEGRNQLILRWLNKAAKSGRTPLVLGERVAQLYDLCDATRARSKAVHVGAMKQHERTEALTKQVVFATQQLAREGLDRPAFDTLFILFPFGGEGRLRQSIGRILRILSSGGTKKPPLVVIFVDVKIGIMRGLMGKMRRHLTKLEYEVKDVKGSTVEET